MKNNDIGQFAAIYRKLEPDSINVKVDDRMVKLSNHLMEFFHFNYMFAVISEWPHYKSVDWGAMMMLPSTDFVAADIVQAAQRLPDFIMPEYRKKQQYISSILSKNEIHRTDDYNRKLFVRTKTGHYLVNPRLELSCGGNWINFYDLIHFPYYTGSEPPTEHWMADYCYIQALRETGAVSPQLIYEDIQACVYALKDIQSYESLQSLIKWQESILSSSRTIWQKSRSRPLVEKYLAARDYTQ